MDLFITIVKFVFAGFFSFAGIMHIIKPKLFKHFIPKPLPKNLVNYVAGVIEVGLGVGLLFPQFIKESAMGILILLVLFLPIHIWDVTRERPAIGSKKLAIIRIPLQFLLMYLAYLIYLQQALIIA
jgi:uncharacterized membrane protein